MKIILICPIKNSSERQSKQMSFYMASLLEDKNNEIIYPYSNTIQNSICNCDEIHIFWDVENQGNLFDLKTAFTLNKLIVIINISEVEIIEKETETFLNMIKYGSES